MKPILLTAFLVDYKDTNFDKCFRCHVAAVDFVDAVKVFHSSITDKVEILSIHKQFKIYV